MTQANKLPADPPTLAPSMERIGENDIEYICNYIMYFEPHFEDIHNRHLKSDGDAVLHTNINYYVKLYTSLEIDRFLRIYTAALDTNFVYVGQTENKEYIQTMLKPLSWMCTLSYPQVHMMAHALDILVKDRIVHYANRTKIAIKEVYVYFTKGEVEIAYQHLYTRQRILPSKVKLDPHYVPSTQPLSPEGLKTVMGTK